MLLLLTTWMHSNSVWRRVLAAVILAVGIIAIAFVIGFVPSRVLSAATEGRWDLWRAGISKFTERPLLGWGYLSWKDDLVSRLPGEYQLTNYLAKNIIGGYHNQFVAALAEHGLLGLAALLTMYTFAVRCAWKLAYGRTIVWAYGKVALFGILFVLVRANVELDGFFGFSQDPADYATYVLLAILISRLSIEEVHRRIMIDWRPRPPIPFASQLRPKSPRPCRPEGCSLGECS